MNYSSIAPRGKGLRGHIIGWSDGLIRKEPRSVAYGQQLSPFWSLQFIEFALWHTLCLFFGAKIVSNFLCRRMSGYFWTNDGFLEYVLLRSPDLVLRVMIIRYLQLSSSSWTNDLVNFCLWLTVTTCLLPARNRINNFSGVNLLTGFDVIILVYQTILTTRRIALSSDLLSCWAWC